MELASENERCNQHILMNYSTNTSTASATSKMCFLNRYKSLSIKKGTLTFTKITDTVRNKETKSFTFSNHHTGRDETLYPLRVTADVDQISESSIMVAPLWQAMKEISQSQHLVITLSIVSFHPIYRKLPIGPVHFLPKGSHFHQLRASRYHQIEDTAITFHKIEY